LKIVELLLNHKANVECNDGTSVHYVLYKLKYYYESSSKIEDYIKIINLLIDNMTDVNVIGDGGTILHLIIDVLSDKIHPDFIEIIQKLIDKKADINISWCRENDDTPLHLAAANGCLEIVEMLIDNGVCRYRQNAKNQTPTEVAKIPEIRQIIETRTLTNWSPQKHFHNTVLIEREIIRTLLLIRLFHPSLSLLPNELMFLLFQWIY
jgi:ankyrin repeat protein